MKFCGKTPHSPSRKPLPNNLDVKETQPLLAAKLYEKDFFSLGQTAQLAGYSKRTFMKLLTNYDVLVYSYSEAGLDKEILYT